MTYSPLQRAPVSYTHLDVYKRQIPFLVKAIGQPVHSHYKGRDRVPIIPISEFLYGICLLYTSYDEVELTLTEHLGRRVKVLEGPAKGIIEIEFYNQDDLKQLANSIVPDAE